MPSLNMQSDREVRYHERCQQKKLEQQNMDRDDRVQRRDDMRSEISMEVRDEIQQLTQKKKVVRILYLLQVVAYMDLLEKILKLKIRFSFRIGQI
mgnify:CR=1 FL=1